MRISETQALQLRLYMWGIEMSLRSSLMFLSSIIGFTFKSGKKTKPNQTKLSCQETSTPVTICECVLIINVGF